MTTNSESGKPAKTESEQLSELRERGYNFQQAALALGYADFSLTLTGNFWDAKLQALEAKWFKLEAASTDSSAPSGEALDATVARNEEAYARELLGAAYARPEELQAALSQPVEAKGAAAAGEVASALADYVADNWPMRKYSLEEIEAKLRELPVHLASAPAPQAAAAEAVRKPITIGVYQHEDHPLNVGALDGSREFCRIYFYADGDRSYHALAQNQAGTELGELLKIAAQPAAVAPVGEKGGLTLTRDEISKVRAAKRNMVDALIGSGMNYGTCGAISHLLEKLIAELDAKNFEVAALGAAPAPSSADRVEGEREQPAHVMQPFAAPAGIIGGPGAASDKNFHGFWYGSMEGDIMTGVLSSVSYSTAKYIWDAASRCRAQGGNTSEESGSARFAGEAESDDEPMPTQAETLAAEAKLYRDLTGDVTAMGYDGLVDAIADLKRLSTVNDDEPKLPDEEVLSGDVCMGDDVRGYTADQTRQYARTYHAHMMRKLGGEAESVDTDEFREVVEFWSGKYHSALPMVRAGHKEAWAAVVAHVQGLVRAASGGNPELTVWYGSMPESNGKSNFTAMLMRKGASLLDGMENGFTIARSEYPDRVRYEADCVRYLIGELAEKPWILDYDDDKHSGYVKPAASTASGARDGWISVEDQLPETRVTDDSECWLQGKRINAAINSDRVLVALSGQGVRVDRLGGLEGNAPYWETYGKRVTHWMPLPAAPSPAAPAGKEAK